MKLLSVTGCDGAPLLPLLFVIVNMGFNISLLHLLKISSAVVSCLASTLSGQLTIRTCATFKSIYVKFLSIIMSKFFII